MLHSFISGLLYSLSPVFVILPIVGYLYTLLSKVSDNFCLKYFISVIIAVYCEKLIAAYLVPLKYNYFFELCLYLGVENTKLY